MVHENGKLIQRMRLLGYNEQMMKLARERVLELESCGVQSVNKFVKKLKDRLSDKEEYLDILMEGRFAVILARNSFSNIHIEYCKKGSDLKADWNGKTIFFEVTRKRANRDEWEDHSEAMVISPIPIENIIRKIEEKLSQLTRGETNIIFFWSDTIELGSHEVEEAFTNIQQKINDAPESYEDLSGILFTEGGGVDTTTMKQFHLFKNNNASKPIGIRLTKKLESLHEQDIRILQREWDEIAAAMKRLKS